MVERRPVSRTRKIASLIVLAGLVFGVIPYLAWESHSVRRSVENYLGLRLDRKHHFYDYAGVVPSIDNFGNTIEKFEHLLAEGEKVSGVDIRIVLVTDTERKSIEELAVEKVETFRIGGRTQEERGVLLLYDMSGKRLRVEVGYGLESYFPDAFVSYLVHDHAPGFFSSHEVSAGIYTLVQILFYRLLEAALGDEFNFTVLNVIKSQGHLSGGAGASITIMSTRQGDIFRMPTKEEREYYSAQPTPEGVFTKYLQWLQAGQFIPALDIFTKETQGYMVTLPMSKAYLHYLLMKVYGYQYKIFTRGNVALLYFTTSPLPRPFYLVRGEKGWQLDEYTAIINRSGLCDGDYVWNLTGQNTVYTRTFSDRLVNIKGCIRIADGDNRELPLFSH